MDNKYLKLARQAREEDNTEDAKKFYDMARTEDPENVEAKFFYAYYNLEDAINRDVPNKFSDYCKVAVACISRLKEVELEESEKIELLTTIVKVHTATVFSTYNYISSKSTGDTAIYSAQQRGTARQNAYLSLINIAESIEKAFAGNEEAIALAVLCWKKILTNPMMNSQYFFTSAGKDKEASKAKWEEVVAKIHKVDPSFNAPQPKKCVIGG